MTRLRALPALLLVVLLGGCDGPASDSGPTVLMPSANDWPPPSVLELEEPEAPTLDRPSSATDALEFTTYLTDSMSWMMRTTFNAPVLRDHDCPVCSEFVELADTARAERRLYEFRDVIAEVEDVQRLEPLDPSDQSEYWYVDLLLDRPEIHVLDEHGDEIETLPAERTRTDLRLAMWEGDWYVIDWVPRGQPV